MKKAVLLLMALLLATGFAQAKIVSPKSGSTFHVGEEIRLIGFVGSNTSCSGTSYLSVNDQLVTQTTRRFYAGEIMSLEGLFGNNSLPNSAGNKNLKIYSDCFLGLNIAYTVENNLDIIYSLNRQQAMLNDEIAISAYAFTDTQLWSITKIQSGKTEYIDNAVFSFSSAGEKTISLSAQDQYGNKNNLTLIIDIFDELALDVNPGKTTAEPLEIIPISLTAKDSFGQPRVTNITIAGFGTTTTREINGEQTIDIIAPQITAPGNYTITVKADSNGNTAEKTISVLVKAITSLVVLSTNKYQFSPNEKLEATVTALDQSGGPVNGNAILEIKTDAGTALYSKEVASGATEQIILTNYFPAGTLTVFATLGQKQAQRQVYLNQEAAVDGSAEVTATGVLETTVTNTGNIQVDSTVIQVCDDEQCRETTITGLTPTDSERRVFTNVKGTPTITVTHDGESANIPVKTQAVSAFSPTGLATGAMAVKDNYVMILTILVVLLAIVYARRWRMGGQMNPFRR